MLLLVGIPCGRRWSGRRRATVVENFERQRLAGQASKSKVVAKRSDGLEEERVPGDCDELNAALVFIDLVAPSDLRRCALSLLLAIGRSSDDPCSIHGCTVRPPRDSCLSDLRQRFNEPIVPAMVVRGPSTNDISAQPMVALSTNVRPCLTLTHDTQWRC